ncbi:MAG: PAS domain-containing sensor histidine kinase [Bacteroidales bacterium]
MGKGKRLTTNSQVADNNTPDLLQELEACRKKLELKEEELSRTQALAQEATNKLSQSEERYTKAFLTSSYAITITSIADGKFIDINDAFTVISGYSRAEALSDSSVGLALWVDINDRNFVISELKAGREVFGMESRFNRKNGEIMFGLISAQVIYLNNEPYILSSINDITQRKLSESALKDKTILLSNLLVNLKEGILLEDAARKIVLTNQLFCDLFGIPAAPEAMIGMDCSQSADQSKGMFKDPDKFIAKIGLILRYRIPVFNDPLELTDGRFFERDYIPTYVDGVYNGHLWKYRDVTGQKLASTALRESEEKFRSITEQTSDLISITDTRGFILYASAASRTIFNIDPDEMCGHHFSEFLEGGVFSDAVSRFRNALASDQVTKDLELRMKRKDGSLFYGELSGSKFRYGTQFGTLVVIRDVTERKLARVQLEKSEERFRQVVEHSHEVVWEVDHEGLFTFVSPLSSTIYGYTPEELVGKKYFYDLHPEQGREQFKEAAFGVFLRKESFNNLINHISKPDGTVIVLSTNGIPMVNDQGRLFGYRGADSDITERIMAEEELHKLNVELEQRVAERTSQLELANKELDAFSYSISHDLRAPLRHINGFINLLKDVKAEGRSAEEIQYMEFISNGSQEMSLLIDALLSFSRLNRAELRKTTLNTYAMVQQVIRFFEPETRNRKITYNIGQLIDCEGDEQLIKQVWTNLISNAIKYTGKKPEAVIGIWSERSEDKITFVIQDNGAGFDMQFSGKLFGVFKRLHRPGDFEGVGVGLANVQSIVTRHGGLCNAEGTIDKGATFTFTLPVPS